MKSRRCECRVNPEKNISVDDILDVVAPVLASIQDHYWAGFRHVSPENAFLVYFERELISSRRDGSLPSAVYDELVEWYEGFSEHLWFWRRESDDSIETPWEVTENIQNCDSSELSVPRLAGAFADFGCMAHKARRRSFTAVYAVQLFS